MRAFANFLRVSPGALSEILAKKRRLTVSLGARLADRLAFAPDEKALFLDRISDLNPSPRQLREQFHKELPQFTSVAADEFALIADWEHFAILSLVETAGFKSDTKWMGKRLGIPAIQVEQAIDRLLRLGMLVRRNGELHSTQENWTTPTEIPSAALRRSHRQSIEQALDALETVEIEKRSVTSITMAINPAKIPAVKKKIEDFRRSIAQFLEEDPKTEVYNLNIQLVPVTVGGKSEEMTQ